MILIWFLFSVLILFLFSYFTGFQNLIFVFFFFSFVWLCVLCYCFTKLCCWLLKYNEKKVFVNWFRLVCFVQLKWIPLANSNKTMINSMFTLWRMGNSICFAENNCDDIEIGSLKCAQPNFFLINWCSIEIIFAILFT